LKSKRNARITELAATLPGETPEGRQSASSNTQATTDISAAVVPFEARLTFSGRGSEYFRIWIVNTLLTLLTLGAYSAWAKVRKTRWFAQHTQLLGDSFDYHGKPWRIFLGRLLALALLAAYSHAFDFSLVAGFVTLGVLYIVGPVLFASAHRFRLANTSWRGLRFSYAAPRRRIFLTCVPLLLLWTFGTVLARLGIKQEWILATVFLPVIPWPWAHARLKQLQHGYAGFGGQSFRFESAVFAFYKVYGWALLLFVVLVLGYVWAIATTGFAISREFIDKKAAGFLAMFVIYFGVWQICLVVWSYLTVRLQNLVWAKTRWGDVRFRSEMHFLPFTWLLLRSGLLTLLSAGLYWPFAAVAIARYRVENLLVESEQPLENRVIQGAGGVATLAAGDAAADLFGLDLGW